MVKKLENNKESKKKKPLTKATGEKNRQRQHIKIHAATRERGNYETGIINTTIV